MADYSLTLRVITPLPCSRVQKAITYLFINFNIDCVTKQMDRVNMDSHLETRQIKLCATCFDLYHGLARALEMVLCLAPNLLTKPDACDNQNELLLGRTCQVNLDIW